MTLIDAHNHLHDSRLAPHLAAILPMLASLGVRGALVNGTREDDWDAVAALSRAHDWVTPSFGLHPWYAPQRSQDWLEKLRHQLDAHPHCGVGEIGLDRWIKGHDLADQSLVFTAQLRLAAERDLPVTIHCIQAWGALWEIIRVHPLPTCGFLLHAYGGPMEMTAGFLDRGAYFSFSPLFLHERKAAQREIFAALPADRILVETDAPDLRPPDDQNPNPLHDDAGQPINHPANLAIAYAALARIRGVSLEALADTVAANFGRWIKSQRPHPPSIEGE